jgi:uncharacterized protein (TIGR03067 family)
MGMTVSALALLIVEPEASDKALQGAWVVAKAQREGKEAPDVVGHRLVIDGDGFEIRKKDELLFKGVLAIDKSRGPLWRVDITHSHGDLKGKKWLGVMQIRKDGIMEICDNAIDPTKPRPEKLESSEGSGTILLDFKRASN